VKLSERLRKGIESRKSFVTSEDDMWLGYIESLEAKLERETQKLDIAKKTLQAIDALPEGDFEELQSGPGLALDALSSIRDIEIMFPSR
jgi:hypothetical protein